MGYVKQEFKSGDTLTAAALNAMDEQIYKNAYNIGGMEDGGYYTPNIDVDGNLAWTPSKEDMPEVEGANIKGPKGDPGEKGDKGDTGEAGKDGVDANVTKENIEAALGYTPANQTDVDNLSEQIVNYLPKNQGSSNVGKILVVGTDGNLILTDMPEGGTSGDVTGVLDESNNILLSGNLADGTYTLKYENADGTYTEIGTLEVGGLPEPPNYTNLATTFATGRLRSGGKIDTATTDATVCLDYIPFTQGTVVRVKGFGALTDYNCAMYTAEPTSDMIGVVTDSVPTCYGVAKANASTEVYNYSYDSTSGVVTITSVNAAAKVMRVSGVLTGTTDDVIITVNEEIA